MAKPTSMRWPRVKDGCEIFSYERFRRGVRVETLEVFRDQLDTALSNLLCVRPALSKVQNQTPPDVLPPIQLCPNTSPPDPFLASVPMSLEFGCHSLDPDVTQLAVITLQCCTEVLARCITASSATTVS